MKETADFYGRHWSKYYIDIEVVLNHIKKNFGEDLSGKLVLDAGCGHGMVSIGFAMLGADVVAVDISEGAIEAAKRRAQEFGVSSKIRFIVDSLLDFKYPFQFDIIYSWGVLHHTGDTKRAFLNLSTLLKPGGIIFLALYRKTSLSSFWNATRYIYIYLPRPLKLLVCVAGAGVITIYDFIRTLMGYRYEERAKKTSLVDDWFGVPVRSFHTPEEVEGWCKELGLKFELITPYTGRFKSTSNFEVKIIKPL